MKVEIWFHLSSQPVVHENVKATYQKGSLFCVLKEEPETLVFKYPIEHIFCIRDSDFIRSHRKAD